jgi:hypothetical protein
VTLRARWVTLRARWVTLRARWVTLRARWVTLRAGRAGYASVCPHYSRPNWVAAGEQAAAAPLGEAPPVNLKDPFQTPV